jgi:hypothetical protein
MKINGENVNVKQVDVDVVNGFYSPLEKIISESKFDKLPAKQWAEKFAKGEEAKWTGLADWLSQQQGSVSKADIQKFLKDNRINIVEVVKGGDIKGKLKKIADKHNLRLDFGQEGELDIVNNEDGELYRRGDVKTLRDVAQLVELNLMSEEKALAIKEIFDLNEPYAYELDNFPSEVKFAQYQLEGEKENYKEVLVTMPKKKVKADGFEISETDTVIYEDRGMGKPLKVIKVIPKKFTEASSEANKYISDNSYKHEYNLDYNDGESVIDALKKGGVKIDETNFESSHFDEPNILVHLRMNTRKDSQGNKVLFLEEIQSDWGQKGKKEGFKNEKEKVIYNFAKSIYNIRNRAALKSITSEEANKQLKSEKVLSESQGITQTDIEKALDKYGDFTQSFREGTPTAPFVMDTNAWTKLALKVALKEAVKQGVDKIAWTTGEQQNERYDLSKSVSKLSLTKDNVLRAYNLNGEKIYDKKISSEKEIEDTFGKDAAQKLLEQPTQKVITDYDPKGIDGRELSGVDLKVGGKGMKGFYGSPTEGSLGIVGNVAKSLFKQEPKTTEIVTDSGYDMDRKNVEWDKVKVNAVKVRSGEREGLYFVELDGGGLFTVIKDQYFEKAKEAEAFGKQHIKEVQDQSKFLSTQYSIDITPELRAQVEKGQPMFMAKGSKIFEDYDKYNALKNSEKVKNPQIVEQLKAKYGQELNKVKDITLNFDKYTTQLLNSGYIKDKIC